MEGGGDAEGPTGPGRMWFPDQCLVQWLSVVVPWVICRDWQIVDQAGRCLYLLLQAG